MSFFDEIHLGSALIVGAGQGIGLGFVQRLLLEPKILRVYATYHQKEHATSLISLAQLHPNQLICFYMDVTDEAQIEKCAKKISQYTKELHLVINCVGVLHDTQLKPEKSLRQAKQENLLKYFQINSITSILLAEPFLPLFIHQDSSIFACISAKIGSIGDNKLGGWYGYRASKAALNMFIRTIAIEYRRKSPKTIVVSLHPGTTNTQLSLPFQKNVLPGKLFSVEFTVTQLINVIAHLKDVDSGCFFSWDGSRLPW